MASTVLPLGVDLTDPATFRDGIPHELFARMRAEEPVVWHPAGAFPGFWSVTRHADVAAVTHDAKTFVSSRGVLLFDVPMLADPEFPRMIIEHDAPKHTRYRLLVNRGFTPRMIVRLEDFARAATARIVDHALEAGSFDFVPDVASKLPIQVISHLLGVPESDHDYLVALSNRIIAFDEEADGQQTVEAQMEMCEYAGRLGAAKRKELDDGGPADDIVSVLLMAEPDGERLSEMDFDLFVLILATAGNETTRTAISQGMLAFMAHPEQWSRLQEDRSLLPTAVEEILRYTTPLYYMRRTAARDAEVGAVRVQEGDRVVIWYASANFDETVFDDPLRFDITRTPNEHVTFGGGGPHYCLGAHLARLEVRVMFEELLNRMPSLELAGPIERLRSTFTNGIKHMPVRVA